MDELTIHDIGAPKPIELPAFQKIKDHLDTHGIKYTWFAEKMGFGKSWASGVLNGSLVLTEENRQKAETLLNIKL